MAVRSGALSLARARRPWPGCRAGRVEGRASGGLRPAGRPVPPAHGLPAVMFVPVRCGRGGVWWVCSVLWCFGVVWAGLHCVLSVVSAIGPVADWVWGCAPVDLDVVFDELARAARLADGCGQEVAGVVVEAGDGGALGEAALVGAAGLADGVRRAGALLAEADQRAADGARALAALSAGAGPRGLGGGLR